ncbi:hypothetical protein [Variovorax sp. YR752]|uniref:c-type cytochrome n=1 Tax=Variovorax sp. YR752 TaxID=1884383 RepID=UPI0031377D77
MTVLAVTAHAEGDAKRFRQFSPPPEQKAKAAPKTAAPGLFSSPGLAPSAAVEDSEVTQLPNKCPDTGDERAWTEWRDIAIKYLLLTRKPTREERRKASQTLPYLHEQDVLTRSSQIVVALERCSATGKPPPPDGPRDPLRTLKRFVRTQHNANYLLPNPQHQFGHGPVKTDDDYLCEARPAIELPCLLRRQDFLTAMRHPSTYWEALDLIKQRNDGTLEGECKEATPKPPWDTLIYRSRFLTAPDREEAKETLGRLLVVVPGLGPEPDRWVQFGIWTPQDSCYGQKKDSARWKECHIHNVSIVAVAKIGGPKPPAVAPLRTYDAIADWWRCVDGSCHIARSADGAILARDACNTPGPVDDKTVQLRFRLQVNGESDDCQRCHKMMPLSIHPEKVYRIDKNKRLRAIDARAVEKAADVVNDRIRDWESWYGRAPVFSIGKDDTTADWRNYGSLGLGTGPRSFRLPPRSDRWLQVCSARAGVKLDAASRQKVSNSMGCAKCHNGRDGGTNEPAYGVLNYPQGTDKRQRIRYSAESPLAPNIVRSHILRGVMPLDLVDGSDPPKMTPKGGLNRDERKALFECLSLEYFDPVGPRGLFVDWLKNEGEDPANPPTTLVEITKPDPGGAASLYALAASATAAAATPASDFSAYCAECHATNGNATAWGPALRGVAGASMASTSFRRYSPALRELAQPKPGQPRPVWDEANLLELLKDPDAFLGKDRHTSAMHGVGDEDARRRIVQYLSTLK